LHNKTPTKQKQLRGSSTDAKKEKNILREEEEAHGSSIQLNKQQQMRLMNLTKRKIKFFFSPGGDSFIKRNDISANRNKIFYFCHLYPHHTPKCLECHQQPK
jgi:hypothetical protein